MTSADLCNTAKVLKKWKDRMTQGSQETRTCVFVCKHYSCVCMCDGMIQTAIIGYPVIADSSAARAAFLTRSVQRRGFTDGLLSPRVRVGLQDQAERAPRRNYGIASSLAFAPFTVFREPELCRGRFSLRIVAFSSHVMFLLLCSTGTLLGLRGSRGSF